MDGTDTWTLAQVEYGSACAALKILENALPEFRSLVASFSGPMTAFLAAEASGQLGALSDLSSSLSRQLPPLSERQRLIAADVAIAKGAMERCQGYLRAIDRGSGALGELQVLGSCSSSSARSRRSARAFPDGSACCR
jgi:hypothetical protein